MKDIIDNFSAQAEEYSKFRPTYPKALYDIILLAASGRSACWDCGTGNGQVALELSKHFKHVYATDISEEQIKRAGHRPNITYEVSRAERTNFKDNSFDLITIAQALHWFDLDAFNLEIRRTMRNGGIVCAWGYGLMRIDENIDRLIETFYSDIIGPYWDSERHDIENNYTNLKLDFDWIPVAKNLEIGSKWKLQDLIGYLNSWSGVQNYKGKNNGQNPVELILEEMSRVWSDGDSKEVVFPIFIKMGRIEK